MLVKKAMDCCNACLEFSSSLWVVVTIRPLSGNEASQYGQPFLDLGFLQILAVGLDHVALADGGEPVIRKHGLHVDNGGAGRGKGC
jgi:hypothetical protein